MTSTVLERARAGDGDAFRQLVQPYRRELHLHCYRLLGSLTDAEDVLQDVLFAAWRGLDRFEERASVRTWLYRIATNRCLNARRDAGRRPAEPLPPFDPPEPTHRGEITWLQPYPDALLDPALRYEDKEAVSLAFVTGLQLLPPRQAATLVLRDVLGFGAPEVAGLLGATETAVKGALQRARAALDRHRGAAPPVAGSPEERDLTRRFADAFTAGDVDGVVALLTDDAWLTMPPAPHEYHGPAAVEAFLRAGAAWRGARTLRLLPTRANGQPAFGCYHTEPSAREGQPAGLLVLTLAGDRLACLTRCHVNDVFPFFGLPATTCGDDGGD